MSNIDVKALKRAVSIESVLDLWGIAVKKDGATRMVSCCPFHDDKTPSFAIDPVQQLWKCHGPCDVGGDVIALVQKHESVGFLDAAKWLAHQFHFDIGDAPAATKPSAERKKVAEYIYTDDAGVQLYRIERWEPGKNNRNKDFVQKLADGTPKKSERQVLYKLPAIKATPPHESIFIVEGEKCAEALASIGLVATTCAGGTGAWRTWTAELAAPLAGKKCVVIPDNDEGGLKLARHIVAVLQGAGASEVRWLELPLKKQADDVVDWLAGGGTREQLLELAARATPAADDVAWRSMLMRTDRGEIRPTVGNALSILENDDAFRGTFWFHERELAVYADRGLPWDKPKLDKPRLITDDDPVFGAQWCEQEMKAPISAEAFGKALWALARRNRRDPLVEYLRALKWDGAKRAETWLIRHAKAPDTRYVRAVSKAWLVSACARAFTPGCKVDHVLVLEGKQGLKKSSMLAALAGLGGFADNIPDVDSKDTALILGRTWILELAELESMRKSEVTQMNAFVTRTHDVFRPPYDRTTIVAPRRCVFAATTNDDTYLRDPTGARRWWPVACGKITFDELVRERDQLWAEAVHAFKAGEPWWFTDTDLVDLAKLETDQREQLDPWEDILSSRLDGTILPVSVAECLGHVAVEKSRQGEAEAKRVGKVMRRLGWYRRQTRVGARREWRFYPPGSVLPPDPGDPSGSPPVTGGGSDRSTGDTTGDTTQPRASPVSPVSPVVSRAGAHTQGAIDFRSHLIAPSSVGKSFNITGDTGDTGDNPQPNAAKPVTGVVTGVERHDASPVTVDPAAIKAAEDIAEELWGERQ